MVDGLKVYPPLLHASPTKAPADGRVGYPLRTPAQRVAYPALCGRSCLLRQCCLGFGQPKTT